VRAPTASSSAAVEGVQIYYARSDEEPLAVALDLAAGMPVEQRVYARFAALDFAVAEDDWGLYDRAALRAFVEQVVFTATDERSIYRVRLRQNGGQDAVIATADAVVTYDAPLTREIVAPNARPDWWNSWCSPRPRSLASCACSSRRTASAARSSAAKV
jgi:hypothetical protein